MIARMRRALLFASLVSLLIGCGAPHAEPVTAAPTSDTDPAPTTADEPTPAAEVATSEAAAPAPQGPPELAETMAAAVELCGTYHVEAPEPVLAHIHITDIEIDGGRARLRTEWGPWASVDGRIYIRDRGAFTLDREPPDVIRPAVGLLPVLYRRTAGHAPCTWALDGEQTAEMIAFACTARAMRAAGDDLHRRAEEHTRCCATTGSEDSCSTAHTVRWALCNDGEQAYCDP